MQEGVSRICCYFVQIFSIILATAFRIENSLHPITKSKYRYLNESVKEALLIALAPKVDRETLSFHSRGVPGPYVDPHNNNY